MSISDSIVVMKEGKVQQIGAPQQVYDDPDNLFVAKFLGTPPINVFAGKVQQGMLYLGDQKVLPVKGVSDREVTVGIRPEGFGIKEDGAMCCQLNRLEVMGRDLSVICTHAASENPFVRAIISQEQPVDATKEELRFSLKPGKVFLFEKETGRRIRYTQD